MRRPLLAAIIIAAIATPALARNVYLAVRDWPVEQFIGEIDRPTRVDMLTGMTKVFDVEEKPFHACLEAKEEDSLWRRRPIHEAIDDCIADLRGWKK